MKHKDAFIATREDVLSALSEQPGEAYVYDIVVKPGCYLGINGELSDEEQHLLAAVTSEDPPCPLPDNVDTTLILKWLCSQGVIEPGNWVIYQPPYVQHYRDRCA